MIQRKDAARGYAAIGSEPRLNVLLLLVKTGEGGLTISEIGGELGFAPSTLAHHLRYLVDANLVVQDKRGREVYNSANFDYLKELGNYILLECCVDADKKRVRG